MTILKYEPKWTDSPSPNRIKTLIVDNYDSYTFNLLQLFTEEQLRNVMIVRNDQFEWTFVQQEILPFIDQIILSPGPGRPERPEDFGICRQILQTTTIPVFGVCLGHQGIGIAHGAKVTYGAEPVHGQIAQIEHTGSSVFTGLPQRLEAVRYHSLVIQEDSLPDDLIPTAWCYSTPLIPQKGPALVDQSAMVANVSHFEASLPVAKSIMGVQHRYLPHHGVQFHPESICTQHGHTMMQNFFNITREYYATRQNIAVEDDSDRFIYDLPDRLRRLSVVQTDTPTRIPSSPSITHSTKPSNFHLLIQALDPSIFPETEQVFESLFLTGPRSTETSWWLDSARQPHPMSRFSFMGGSKTRTCSDPGYHENAKVAESRQLLLQYSTLHKEITTRYYGSAPCTSSSTTTSTTRTISTDSFWDWTSELLNDIGNMDTTVIDSDGQEVDLASVPFDFMAGLVGYFGYEMKRESLEGYNVPPQQQCHCQAHGQGSENTTCSCECLRTPDATFFLATQAVVFDHQEHRIYLLGVVNKHTHTTARLVEPIGFSSMDEAHTWLDYISTEITRMARASHNSSRRRSSIFGAGVTQNGKDGHNTPFAIKQRQRRKSSASLVSPFKNNFTEDEYLDAIHKSLDYIHEGESYEICLTSQFKANIPLERLSTTLSSEEEDKVDEAFELYKILRRLNPAPFSTFLSYPTNNIANPPVDTTGSPLIDRQLILGSSPERFIRLGQKPADEVGHNPQKRESSRTVEMKPIKGTVAVAKGCFCSEDEGCSLDTQSEEDGTSSHGHDEGGDDEDEHKASNAPSLLISERRARKDLCEDARRREDQRRIETLGSNLKERAENLMIVDLIRNDLAHVCASHSVRVPYLMRVESYETVHQLVTTVRGELRPGVNGAQAIKACFPPGSMTGAPKLRSVQLLDELERHQRRGVYSGCLGYIGFSALERHSRKDANGHANESSDHEEEEIVRTGCDMSVVIRSGVLNRPSRHATLRKMEHQPSLGSYADQVTGTPTHVMGELSVGAGGALTILSDPHEEWREVVLKSRSVVPR
ncbi:hypothetical protein BGW41_001034 [Actinomortierella wolfii]|nr:hypothetical protein BGW41_001034 [Actinomortierella wolfii]